MDDVCHVRVLWLSCGTVRGHVEVAGDLEGERQVSCIWVAGQGGWLRRLYDLHGTGTLTCSISNCVTLKKTGSLIEATGRRSGTTQDKSPCEVSRWAPDRAWTQNDSSSHPPLWIQGLLAQQLVGVHSEPASDFFEL